MRRWLKGVLFRALNRRGLAVVPRPVFLCANPHACLEVTFDHVLSHHLLHQTRVPYFVQVGAFDGVSGDPLHFYVRRGLLRGCLVEPQADAFEQLRANYAGHDGVRLKRAAIAAESGTATLYRVRPGTAGPEWLHQIASFRREVLLTHAPLVPGLEEAIVAEPVPAVTFADLFAELGTHPDIVVVDAEGYDFEVVKLLLATPARPRIILYEHKHLSDADHNACLERLAAAGYRVARSGCDTVACLPDAPG